MRQRNIMVLSIFAGTSLFAGKTLADGNRIAPLHLPYVQQLEKEIEYSLLLRDNKDEDFNNSQLHSLAYGQAIAERLLLEVGLQAEGDSEHLVANTWEIEAIYQLSEQGEFNNDWALAFEVERNTEENSWEMGSTLIVLHEWAKWTGLVNAALAYEWGSGIEAEIESHVAGQLKYRYKPALEPAIEMHKGQDNFALGPSVSGLLRFSGQQKLIWNAGFFFGMEDDTADRNFLFHVEYEFY